MSENCRDFEQIGKEFAEQGNLLQAAYQFRNAADCYKDKVNEMVAKSAEHFHMHAESLKSDKPNLKAQAYFEAAIMYKRIGDYANAITLFELARDNALEAKMTELAAQSCLWVTYSSYRSGRYDYIKKAAKSMGELYEMSGDQFVKESVVQKAVMSYILSAVGYSAVLDDTKAKELIEKTENLMSARKSWDWLMDLFTFAKSLLSDDYKECEKILSKFAERPEFYDILGAALKIREESKD